MKLKGYYNMLDGYFPLYLTIFSISMIITVILEKRLIPMLSARARQPIYEVGPKWHMSKSGTPTMGGIAFLIAVSASIGLAVAFMLSRGLRDEAVSLAVCGAFSLLNSAIGIIDDMTKLTRRQNAGLRPYQKLLFQLATAIGFLVARHSLLGDDTAVSFAFGEVELGFLYYPMAIIILLGIVNCANLTDGIDGLASGVAFAVGISLFYISAALVYDVAVIAAAIIGAAVGFLFFNIHPARIFMGDTGSLFFGALAVSAVFSLDNPLLVILIGGVYVLEGVSVILQVVAFKITGKRIFKMAPVHHHLERCGMGENKICMIAIIATLVFSVPAFILYLP